MKRDLPFVLTMLAGLAGLAAAGGGCTEHGKGGLRDAGGGVPGAVCGGFGNALCGPGQFCDFGANRCGGADETGTCVPRPDACDDNLAPVCGCDGQVYSNDCDAFSSGVDVNASGGCRLEQGNFECGFRICEIETTYCQVFGSDVGGEPDGFECVGFPACGVHDCACLATEVCGRQCSGDATVGLRLTCLGG